MKFPRLVFGGSRIWPCALVICTAIIGVVGLCPLASGQAIRQDSASAQSSSERSGGRTGKTGGRDAGPPLPTPRTADGQPDLSGVWNARGGAYINKEVPGGQLPYAPAGLAAYQYNMTQSPDPQSLCIIIGQPRADLDDRPFEIVQNSTRLAFLYERDAAFRVVRIDGSPHPPEPEPTFFGDAVGHWEGDTLVVDVTALKGQKVWADNVGHPHSDEAHIVERWSRSDKDHLVLDLTMDDPKYYTQSLHLTRAFRLQSWPGVGEEACDENNVDRAHLGPGLGTKDGSRGFDKSILQAPPPTAPATAR